MTPPDRDAQLQMLRAMHEIRFFEDACHRLFATGSVRGTTHLCQGQEAVTVGTLHALRPEDQMTCTYRGHGAVLAKGVALDRSFGEILGKADGLCGGKGGSMHLTDVDKGALGSFAIVGGHLPVAVGVAFAARYRRTDELSVCFFGDGSTNIGAFHESLNLASIWKLPVLFVCENNLYGEYSPLHTTTPIEVLADRAAAYGMPGIRIDGNDVLGVHATVTEAAARARAGEGPTLIEMMTYRQKGHSRADPAAYRPDGELEAWLARDPIVLHERSLLADGVAQEQLDAIRAAAEEAVEAALERAQSWPDPDPETRLEHVYA
ncbi:thiamine pyrophosphate-dependent dehydrogenase E1 component subunit alpha [Conexibacter sp. JD483]|uniref:thiamine pyrophosphate-dependent dehydrogenase E1 component subunit alpha n=1 Tax=unclassified Conexibacter TaxID=2627773 RepID=UPI002716F910|nr:MULTISPECIES: thiamine pyrophosphate-dependent dehydrogenase E1 component subunit alpha [unclassified Conexibacter]MDO8187055.1 thiamine pyrophosphate-dependent dehydrogenase E1 component subunit alpha [Conexibacter sp. CPCC 205706]MDO8200913.1 thiamine pyrophosphate-dependent dehydrogenase E1 component subunit alpha [Conexibacter sp. CPCC 205762]MDR9372968.1 thiamine pyrophosphate-dependent dehydrogenase E1 component subunit alpha [Conexibacter sp. JD483]